jgi:hypothetical protein
VLEKMAGLQMVDVHVPTTDGRRLVLSRYTQPDRDQTLLLQRLHLTLPEQPRPNSRRSLQLTARLRHVRLCSGDLQGSPTSRSMGYARFYPRIAEVGLGAWAPENLPRCRSG